MKESIFSYLTSYVPTDKREAKEDYLTQMFAWILKNVDGYLTAYARFLSSKNPNIICPADSDMAPIISTQETLPVGRIDLLIRLNDRVSLICEHKVHSELSHNQIKKYMDNSHLLGGGTYYSVLVTYSTVQHTQKADVSITWSDICEFTEQILEDYKHEDAFVLNQFITFLKENGMGKAEPIKPDALLGYWAAVNLEYHLNTVFSQLENVDWNELCPGLKTFSPATFNPKFSKMRWGRLGIDFFESWTPGLFAGILMHTIDHRLQPMDVNKGPDFVVFIESVYDKKNSRHMDIYKSITESQEHRNRTQRLSLNSGSFEYLPGIPDSKWRIAVLRKPLFDILENKYTKQEQFDAIKDAIVEAINLLIAK